MPGIDEVQNWLAGRGIDVLRYDRPTPTAETAAAAVGCSSAEIAKTLLFFVGVTPLIVVTCGDRKVVSSLLKQGTGFSGKVRLPQADEVLDLTGYAPGGVCPFLLPACLPVFLDVSLKRFLQVYTAAGDAASAVPVCPADLATLTEGIWAEVCCGK